MQVQGARVVNLRWTQSSTDLEFFVQRVWEPVFEANCIACHQEGGLAQNTAMVFRERGAMVGRAQPTAARECTSGRTRRLPALLLADGRHPDGHTGGQLLNVDSPGYRILLELVERIDDRIDDCGERQGGEIPLNPSTDAMKFDLVEEC